MEHDLYKHMSETEKELYQYNLKQASLGQGLHQQIQQSNTHNYTIMNRKQLDDAISIIYGISNPNTSDPLWLEYKEENDPKLNPSKYISGSDYYGLKTSGFLTIDPSKVSFINTSNTTTELK